VVFPHDQAYGSASGVFHLALGAGRACICSSSPKFGEAREIFARRIPVAIAPARDVGAWQRAMITLLSNEALRGEAEGLARAGAAASAWPALARRYTQLYRDLTARAPAVGAPRSAARA
jgi:glycosyltransferase involved in cell wall biosynthesis